jgi:tRNA splicing ligase
LEKNGFKTIDIIPNGNYFEYLAQEVNRLPYMAKQYSSGKLNSTQTKTINKLKRLLQNLSDADSNSSELLCFGYHVIARKK